jgi:hypothetical protein
MQKKSVGQALAFLIARQPAGLRKIEKIINTVIPPTYTTICTAAIKLYCIQKNNPAIPTRENNKKIAARNMCRVVTASNPLTNVRAASM